MGAIVAAFVLTAWIGVVALAQGSNAPASSPSTATSPSTTSPAPEDVQDDCDEAEHASDPECLGVIPVAEEDPANDDDQGEDVSDDDQGEIEDDQGEDD